MRFFSFIPVLAALVTAVAGVAVPDDCADTEMGCDPHLSAKREFVPHPARDNNRAMTNAELLRRGLPMNYPVLRRGSPVRRNKPSPSAKPQITHTGVIEVHDSSNDKLLGYVSTDFSYAARIDPSIDNALSVNFQTDQSGSGSEFNIRMTNSDPIWPLFGLVQGRDSTSPDLAPGSFNYLYVAGVDIAGTPPGAPPTFLENSAPVPILNPAETAVWNFNSGTGSLTPQWINTDKSAPPNQIFTQSTIIYVGSDPGAFHSRFPAPVTVITFKFIPK